MTKKEQTITEDEVKKEFKLLKEKGARLKKDLEKLERRRKDAGIGLQDEGDEGGIKGELETLHLLGRVTSIASSSLSRVSDSLHSAAVEVTKDGMAIKDLLNQNPKAAKEYQRILENVKKIYSKEKKEKSVTHEDTLDTLANLLDRHLEDLERKLEEKKAPAVTKKPAPKPEKVAEAAPPDYKSMRWSDLQKLASNRGLKVVGAGVKKDKVIADLKAMDRGEVVAPAEEKRAPAVTKKPAPKPEKVAEAAPPDYKSMRWSDLQKLASNRGLKVVGAGVKKDKVIADLKAMDRGEVVAPAEEKKAPAVPKRPAPKAKKAAKKPAKKKPPAAPKKPAPKPEKAAEKLDVHIKKLEKELEEKKAPAVPKRPAPKAKKAAKKPAKKKAPAVTKK